MMTDQEQEVPECLATSRSRRQLKDRHGRKAAFDKLKELKGSKHKVQLAEIDNVYEEVEEREYAKRRQNRMEENWIIDDDGAGYIEDGREIFDDDHVDDDELFVGKKSKSAKGKSSSKSTKNVSASAAGSNIRTMFANMPNKKQKTDSSKLSDKEKSALEEILMEDLDNSVSLKRPPVNVYGRKRASCGSPIPSSNKRPREPFSKDDKLLESLCERKDKRKCDGVDEKENLSFISNSEPLSKEDSNSKPDSQFVQDEISESVPNNHLEDDMLMDDDLMDALDDENIKETESQKSDDHRGFAQEAPKGKLDSDGLWEISSVAPTCATPAVDVAIDTSQLPMVDNKDGEKVFRFYWLDAYEDFYNKPGVVYLFGKVWIESAQTHVSCCVTVKNIERRIFMLPRLKRLNLKTKEEGDDVTMVDVYTEFNDVIAKKLKITEFRSKKGMKKYCFDQTKIPNEAEYLEVRYSAELPAIPSSLEGETFQHIFGTRTSSLELLLVHQKIKGPCWLEVKMPQLSSPPVSWCKVEAVVEGPNNIKPISGGAPPPLTVMSICMKTSINSKTLQNEINLLGCLIHTEFPIDKKAPEQLFQSNFCVLTKPADCIWPHDFKTKLASHKGPKVDKIDAERSMLGCFLAKLSKYDPDVIVGHDIFGFDLSILLHRIQVNKVPHWSRIGRLKRSVMPKLTSKGFAERVAVCGRLVCDTKISSKELIRAKSYDLDPLVTQVLRSERKEPAVPFKKSFENNDSKSILNWVDSTMQDSLYTLKLISELNVLPLALQITNIAGNVMSRTLLGGRSERNEFLLLHAFAAKDFICPDKEGKKNVPAINADDNEEDLDASKVGKAGRKKASYAGGLVLEPKKGFYDKFILLMDFNSLYPSIIQEYNICFTTVDRFSVTQNDGDLPELPSSDSSPGILPMEIRKLVESRREVKKLMKQQDISSELMQQYDIRQKALKLTANSMYGCLGFSHSRFFAQHLAALITGKGREILLSTKDLVHRLNFEVIYGDTDSIMINTNSSDYDQVFKLGQKIKSEVNKLYRQLELDVDGVFKYMLLLKKKKYAAVTMTKLSDGSIVVEKELKGLDIVRRDWSQLSSDAGKTILDYILSDKEPDERIENIHNHLEKLKEDLSDGKIKLELLTITKQLTKNPTDYPDKNSLPHVQVALRMNSNETRKFRQGDTVPYVICLDGTEAPATQRAYHVDEVLSTPTLKVDTNYYLAHQIHPVISRLCDPIEGTDSSRIAECLGLDPSSYRSSVASSNSIEEDEFRLTEISNEERFRLCERFSFKCPSPDCQILITLDAPTRGIGSSAELLLQSCPNPKCKIALYKHFAFISNKMRQDMRRHINCYYNGWLVCEDPGCSNRTRRIPLKLQRGFPLCNVCNKGVLFREYSEAQLYRQLSFYNYIFDFQKGCQNNQELRIRNEPLKTVYLRLRQEVGKFLKFNAYSVINLGKVFNNLYVKVPVKCS